jgi:hypothetical protein
MWKSNPEIEYCSGTSMRVRLERCVVICTCQDNMYLLTFNCRVRSTKHSPWQSDAGEILNTKIHQTGYVRRQLDDDAQLACVGSYSCGMRTFTVLLNIKTICDKNRVYKYVSRRAQLGTRTQGTLNGRCNSHCILRHAAHSPYLVTCFSLRRTNLTAKHSHITAQFQHRQMLR